MKEREIGLVDLAVEVLLHWRGIILLMLVGGVCIGGIGYVNSIRSAEVRNAQIQKEQEELEQIELEFEGDREAIFYERLTETQISNVKTAFMYENFYQMKLQYKDNSIVMKLNPNSVLRAQILFWVKADDLERAYSIEKVYEGLVYSGRLYDYLESEYGIVSSAASEIITLENETLGKDVNTDKFRLTLVYFDEEQCRELSQGIIDFINTWKQELQQELGEYEIIVLDQSLTTVTDINIFNQQRACFTDIVTNMSTSARLKDAFTDEEQQYYEYLVDKYLIETEGGSGEAAGDFFVENSEIADLEFPVLVKPSFSIKYVVLGMLLAAFVYIFGIFLCYILNNKIRYTDDLQELYDLPQLGQIPKGRERKLFGFVDEWLCAMRDRNKRKFTLDEATNLAAVAVKIAAKKGGLKSISLMGCNFKEKTLETCEKIKAVLEKENIKVVVLNNVLYDAENMEKLSDVQGAVLVETAGSTLYEEISRELDLVRRQSILLLGGVVQE